MIDSFEGLFEGGPSGETPAAFDLSALTVGEATLALQMAMAREGGTRSAVLTDFPIGPDLYTVKAGVGLAEFIQERHDMGPQYALNIISAGRWTVALLADVIYHGLIDGAAHEKETSGATTMTPEKARRVVDRWVKNRPWGESAPTAQIILQAGVVGIPDEPPGKVEGEATQTDPPTSPEEKSGSRPSTDTPPSPE